MRILCVALLGLSLSGFSRAARRRRQAQLRDRGLTLEQISRRLGISRRAVHQLLGG